MRHVLVQQCSTHRASASGLVAAILAGPVFGEKVGAFIRPDGEKVGAFIRPEAWVPE